MSIRPLQQRIPKAGRMPTPQEFLEMFIVKREKNFQIFIFVKPKYKAKLGFCDSVLNRG
jgi:hypothetical protein